MTNSIVDNVYSFGSEPVPRRKNLDLFPLTLNPGRLDWARELQISHLNPDPAERAKSIGEFLTIFSNSYCFSPTQDSYFS